MRRLAILIPTAVLLLAAASPSQALAGPLYDLHTYWANTNLPPGGEGQIVVQARNIGDTAGAENLTITDQLPAGIKVKAIRFVEVRGSNADIASTHCSGQGTETAQCTLQAGELGEYAPAPEANVNGLDLFPSGNLPTMYLQVEIPAIPPNPGINTATLSGGGSPAPVVQEKQMPFDSTPARFGIMPGSYLADAFDAAYPAGAPQRQAGAHPFELRVNFDFNQELVPGTPPTNLPIGKIKTVEATLPRGFIGNPEATPKCDAVDFAVTVPVAGSPNGSGCPADTQVGYLNISIVEGGNRHQAGRTYWVSLYNLQPPRGVPADFGFNAQALVQGHIYPNIDPAHDYAITSLVPEISNLVPVSGSEAVFWGVPGDPAHDKFRAFARQSEGTIGAPWGSAPIRPLLTDPTDCGEDNGGTSVRIESYNDPGQFTAPEEYGNHFNVSGCDDPRFGFEPDISLDPTSRDAGGPTGLDVHLKVPQRNDEVKDAKQLYPESGNAKAIATPPIKKVVVTLPPGMTLNPSAAQGLATCSTAQIGLVSTDPVRFNAEPVTCPDASQYGKLIIHTPILPADNQPEGYVYIAKQDDNPFHNFISLYLVIQEPERGILVKIAGKVELDPLTGQITTTFDELPQFPVSDMQMSLKGGVRAGLVNPGTCGTKTIDAEFFSWQDPSTPHSVEDSYEVTQKPDGSPCVASLIERPFAPTLEAGTLNSTAGAFSPFLLRLARTDEDQELSKLGVTLPPGLAAKFAGVTMCSDAAIAQAISRSKAGQGALERSDPSCPASSLIGTTEAGAGVGVPLTYVPGNVYLAGPYQGAPLSIVVITPAVVGPFDLGVIAVRSALHVDPETAQGSATSDPLPQIFQGIPVRLRDLHLKLSRPDFVLNPTSCAKKQILAHITGTGGDVNSSADDTSANRANRFQASDCASLGFRPKLGFRLFGATKRGSHPALRAVVTYPKLGAYANVARASVTLPHAEFLDQGHIKTVCTRVQFAAQACPAGSIYGHAVAWTPLLDAPLEGSVYLRSSSHQLPDLVAVLRGPASQPIEIDLDGRIDSVHGGIRTTFEAVPDAPVSKFVLKMQGGKKGLLVNSENLCRKEAKTRAIVRLTGQNGKGRHFKPKVANSCAQKGKKKR